MCIRDSKKTPLLSQFDDAWSMRYAVERGTGWRADCLGDMGGFGPSWSHMSDCYPEGIIYGGATEGWKRAPVAFEVCWVMKHWREQGWDPDFIFSEAVRWHFSYFNTKSSGVPDEHWDAVYRCLKRMGYRFVLRKLLCPPQLKRGSMARFHGWWENRGCAPIYRRYDSAFKLANGDTSVTVRTDADITGWLPGDVVYDDAFFVPYDIPAGTYELSAGMLSTLTGRPAIALAQEGRGEDLWHRLGEIEVV